MLAIDHGIESSGKISKPRSKSKLKDQQRKVMDRKKKQVPDLAPLPVGKDHHKPNE